MGLSCFSKTTVVPHVQSVDVSVNKQKKKTKEKKKKDSRPIVYFVCESNTCRSAMAEGIAKKYVAKQNLLLSVRSFGLYAHAGTSASRQSVQVLANHGIDISSHLSTKISDTMLMNNRVTKIICMSEWHKDSIIRSLRTNVYKAADFDLNKIVMLAPSKDVPDPKWGDMEAYEEVYQCLKEYVVPHINSICGVVESDNKRFPMKSPEVIMLPSNVWEQAEETNLYNGYSSDSEDDDTCYSELFDQMYGPINTQRNDSFILICEDWAEY